MRFVRLCIANIFIFLLLCTACNRGGTGNAEVFIPVLRDNVHEIIETLDLAIKHRQHQTIMALYTAESAAAVQRSIQTGLGTAGTIDDLFILEFENRAENIVGDVELSIANDLRPEIRLPSGRRVRLFLVQEDGGWAIDVIASPGGEILLLTD